MNVKATFPAGVNAITVNGLHQWDYGRQLEIQADGLPGLVEVHFACAGMTEAAVRVCDTSSGIAVASIPDTCLEQASPVTAWVYEVGETSGETILTVTMPIIARARPKPGEVVPQPIGDKYTEAIAAMNSLVANTDAKLEGVAGVVEAEVVKGLRDGSVAVTEADHAKEADTSKDAQTLRQELEDGHVVPAYAAVAESAPNVVADIENRLGNEELVPAKAGKAKMLTPYLPAEAGQMSMSRGLYYAELRPKDSQYANQHVSLGVFFYDSEAWMSLSGFDSTGVLYTVHLAYGSNGRVVQIFTGKTVVSGSGYFEMEEVTDRKLYLTKIGDNPTV